MLETREDLKTQVLQDKNVIESKNDLIKRLKVNNNDIFKLMEYRHFILNRSRIIKPNEIYQVAIKVFNKSDFKIKRIEKPLFKYTRISISKNLPENIILNNIKKIASELEAVYREQSLKRRSDLEQISSGKSVLSSVMTLNINGI